MNPCTIVSFYWGRCSVNPQQKEATMQNWILSDNDGRELGRYYTQQGALRAASRATKALARRVQDQDGAEVTCTFWLANERLKLAGSFELTEEA
jgi:hypothetical protein